MERYFDITGSKYGQAIDEFYKYDKKMDAISEEFRITIGVEADKYGHLDKSFYIEPTEEDMEKHGKVLCKPCSNGLRAFKKNSMVGKAFIRLLKEQDMEHELYQPPVAMYIDDLLAHGEKHSSRIINHDGHYYLKITGATENTLDQEDYITEITASEFFTLEETGNKSG